MRYISGALTMIGFVIIMGVVGSDCDGACMENALPIGESILYSLIGFVFLIGGLAILIPKGDDKL